MASTEVEQDVTFDVDRYVDEVLGDKPAPTFRAMGRVWTLSRWIPSLTRVRIGLALRGEELTNDEVRGLFVMLLGEQQTDDLFASGIGQEHVNAILVACVSMYDGNDADDLLRALAAARVSGDDEDPKAETTETV